MEINMQQAAGYALYTTGLAAAWRRFSQTFTVDHFQVRA
jgi:hypothetical protein